MLQTGKSLQSKNYLQSYDNLHHIYNNIGPGAQNSAHTYWGSINAMQQKLKNSKNIQKNVKCYKIVNTH